MRALLSACVAMLAVLLLPLSAQATTPVRGPVRPVPIARPVPPPPPLLATVDHPPADVVGAFDNGPRESSRVALTFDADMTPGMLAQLRSGQVPSWYNQEVREILDAERVPATIFLTGLWARVYPEVARSLARDELFEIGNHSYDHAAFRTPCYGLGAAADRTAEIQRAQEEIEAATGLRPSLFRFPGDCYDHSDAALARELGLTVISGDVRSGDAFNSSAPAIAAVVLRNLRPGSIVIMHLQGGPNAPMTAPALRMIIQNARARGLAFGTVSQVLGRATVKPPAAVAAPVPGQVLGPLRAQKLETPMNAGRRLTAYRLRRLSAPRSPAWRLSKLRVQ